MANLLPPSPKVTLHSPLLDNQLLAVRGEVALALSKLEALVPQYQIKTPLVELGLYLAQKQNDKQAFG